MQLKLEEKILSFQKHIRQFYRSQRRNLPWRRTKNPYHILVSEIMLQQTQVARVERKYPEFINQFPDFHSLSQSPLSNVLKAWQGMGYNRRAIALHTIAKKVIDEHQGKLPQDPEILVTFPGIGRATAHSIVAFAWNTPVAFIETNIRRVFIHHFFAKKRKVSDEEIMELVEETLPKHQAREWYWALMDYGTYLVKQVSNPNKKSTHYRVQSTFKGSNREMRGKILRLLSAHGNLNIKKLKELAGAHEDPRLETSLMALEREGFLRKAGKAYRLVS